MEKYGGAVVVSPDGLEPEQYFVLFEVTKRVPSGLVPTEILGMPQGARNELSLKKSFVGQTGFVSYSFYEQHTGSNFTIFHFSIENAGML